MLGNLVADGDLVLFDRNNHKAAHHGALLIGGGMPIFLPTERNAHGPDRPDSPPTPSTKRAIRESIRANPLVKDPEAWKRERPFRVAVIEQCTYDGTIYDAERIVQRIGHLCDYILFDEAWAGFMKFHPLYERPIRHGADGPLGEASPGIVATQSTHKQLAELLAGLADPHARTATSRASGAASSIAASTKASCSTPRPRPSTRCSPRSTSARR